MMPHTPAGSSSAAFAADLEGTGSFFTSPRSFERTKVEMPEMAQGNFDIPNQMLDEFGQDTLMGLSDLETFLDGMDNGLSTADEVAGISAGFPAPPNASNPIFHVQERSALGTLLKRESATANSRGQEWQQNPNDYIRYVSPIDISLKGNNPVV